MKTKSVYLSKNKKLLKEQMEKEKSNSEKLDDIILIKKKIQKDK